MKKICMITILSTMKIVDILIYQVQYIPSFLQHNTPDAIPGR